MWKSIEILSEELKRTFFSDREAKLEIGRKKSLSQTTPELLTQEPDVVMTDVSYSFVFGSQIDFILTQRNNLIHQWRQAIFLPEVDEAIQELTNEALVFDEDDAIPMEINLDDLEVQDSLKDKIIEKWEKIINLLDFRNKGTEIFRQWYTDGVLNIEAVYDNEKRLEGIQKLLVISPFDFFKTKNIQTGEIEFFYSRRLNSDIYKQQNITMQHLLNTAELKYKPEQITQVTSGVPSADRLFSVSHMNKAMKVINQVSLIEDSIIIYRITRAPEKKAFYIDTGRLPKAKAEQYVQQMMQRHRNKLVYNIETGEIEDRKKTISVLEDYWLTRSADGRGTQIETIQGTGQELRDIADLDYFYDKLYRALNVPINRRDKKDSRFVQFTSNNLDVEKEEIKFYRFVLQLRKRWNEIFRDLLKKELITTKTVSLEDWREYKDFIRFVYKNNNEYAESKKLQVFESRMGIAATANDLVEAGMLSKSWVRREVLNQTEEEIKDIDKERENEKEKEPDENGNGDENKDDSFSS